MILFVWVFVIKQEDKCTNFPVYSFVIEGPELLQKGFSFYNKSLNNQEKNTLKILELISRICTDAIVFRYL